jgi:hypothetical protein
MNCAVIINVLNGLLAYSANKRCANGVWLNEMVILMVL